jgi:DNA polymerase III epsilon subunit-like protein
MKNHVMIDLETLDILPTATILTIGAVKFDPFGDLTKDTDTESLYVKVDIDSCDKIGSTICQDTLEWWARQSAEAQEAAFDPDGRVDIVDAMDQLYRFCWGASKVWSHGAGFDVIILENYFRKVKKAIPWKFWDVRDTRTIFDIGIDPQRPAKKTAHHALEDAVDQAIGVQTVFRKLRDLNE